MAPRLTGLRRRSPGRVAVELDGEVWRTVPDEVVVRAGLVVGGELDRSALRRLRRELRRMDALDAAGRLLSRHDLSSMLLRERLGRAGVAPAEREEAVTTLVRAGLLDDDRLARSRAEVLAGRGWGDAAIVARLRAEGIPSEIAEAALADLPAEEERARLEVECSSDRLRAARRLARRGFDEDTIERVLAPLED